MMPGKSVTHSATIIESFRVQVTPLSTIQKVSAGTSRLPKREATLRDTRF